jgi:hypothetical protein
VEKFSPAPQITGVTLNGKNLTIAGQLFPSLPIVLINQVDESAFIKSNSDTAILVKGKPKRFGLQTGNNTIQVIDQDHHGSNVFTLTL